MKVYIEKDEKVISIDFDGEVVSLLKELKINKETVIVTRSNELLADDDKIINSDDKIKILSVISGG